MFTRSVSRNKFQSALEILTVVYHMTARKARGSRGNAALGLVVSVGMMVAMILIMAIVMTYGFNLRAGAIRGDFMLYVMSGVFMYMMHVRAFSAVAGAGGEVAGTAKATQMSVPVNILSGAFSALYMQLLTVFLILAVYHSAIKPVDIRDPIGALCMLLLSWLSGVCMGVVFLAATPWFPAIVKMLQMAYRRLNVLASGKMFLANSISLAMLPWFIWNPLFHIIDQARGYMFYNYFPRNTNTLYPLKFSATVLVLGLMLEFVTRRSVSASWSKTRY